MGDDDQTDHKDFTLIPVPKRPRTFPRPGGSPGASGRDGKAGVIDLLRAGSKGLKRRCDHLDRRSGARIQRQHRNIHPRESPRLRVGQAFHGLGNTGHS